MTQTEFPGPDDQLWIEKSELQTLVDQLRQDGYAVVGPTIDQGAIVYAEIESTSQLPRGQRDDQAPGKYRLRASGDAYFEFNVGPQSWKQFLFPPRHVVASARKTDSGWQFDVPSDDSPKYALLGVRACELAAIAVQDRVFLDGPFVDQEYRRRREQALIIAVNCTVAADSCFCTSMDTGPRCTAGFDLAMTETEDGFLIEVGSPRGKEVALSLTSRRPTGTDMDTAKQLQQRAVDQITRNMDTDGIRDLLLKNLDHPHWDDVAERCLSCTNCTMVCPTCFCASVTEVTDLQQQQVDRVRQWDSCFNIDFSYTASGVVRGNIRSRYRQWLTHKLASWHDQFDSSGCVGCGRCITWCPVGIDLTAEVAAIRSRPNTQRLLTVPGQAPVACTVPQSTSSADGGS